MSKIKPDNSLRVFWLELFPQFHPLLLVLTGLGFLGNWLHLSLFFGVDFFFGSIAVLSNIYLFGSGWGVLSAVVVSSYTWWLWGDPCALLILTLEALVVGMMLRRHHQNLILLDGIYWLVLGMPLVWLLYRDLLAFSVTATLVVMLKQTMNGVFNALVASLLLNFLPWHRWLRRSLLSRLSLRQMAFHLFTAFVFLPVLLLSVYYGYNKVTTLETDMIQELNRTTATLKAELKTWYQHHLFAVEKLAEIASEGSPEAWQPSTAAIRQASPSFLAMYVTDAQGAIVVADPTQNQDGESVLGSQISDQAQGQAVQQEHQLIFTDIHHPSLVSQVGIAVPILEDETLRGMAYGTINLSQIQALLDAITAHSGVSATLLTQDHQVIVSSQNNQIVLTQLDPHLIDQAQPLREQGVYHWLPNDLHLSTMSRWRHSFYLQATELDNFPWVLQLTMPAAPYITQLEYFYLQILSVLLLIAILASGVAVIVSQWLSRPLQQLTQTTTDLPQKLFNQQVIELPHSQIQEMSALASNFRSMSLALIEKFQELHNAKDQLEQRIKERTRQLLSLNEELATEVVRRKRIETELRDREERYEMAITGTNDGLWDWDLLTNEVYYSPSWLRIVGYEHDPLPQTLNSWLDSVHPDDLDQTIATINDHLEGKTEYYEHTHRLQHRQGHDIWITAKGRCDRNDEGKSYRMVGIITDITEKKQAEQQLQLAKEEAELANRSKSEFLATMSHEIRTPMNAVIGMTGLLLDTPLTNQQREFVEIVRNSGDALLTIINDILDFSKIESGKLDLEEQPFEIRTCVETSLDLVAPKAAEKQLELAYLLAPEVPAVVRGDVTRLRQILVNLLSNGVKFTEVGEVVVTVTAPTPPEPPNGRQIIQFAVRDTGIGIPPDRKLRLFKPFSQVDASTTRRYGGTGLGLAISRRLAQLMGGDMWVESEGGVGSTFSFTIATSTLVQAAEVHPQDFAATLRAKRVLLVDDHATNRQVLTLQTLAFGMQPQAVASAAEALARLETGEKYDVAILDMQMPKMDGLSLATAIRQLPGSQQLPLIILTSLGQPPQIVNPQPKLTTFLSKPVKQAQLYTTLLQTLSQEDMSRPQPRQKAPKFEAGLAEKQPLRILLAEDNVVNQKVALSILKRLGYRADVVANGLEVLHALNRQSYDVILMDVQMPELDGLTTTRQICQRYASGKRPWIIAMTANAMQGDREACLAVGMNDYVSKPVRIEALVAALQKVPPLSTRSPQGQMNQTEPRLDPNALDEIRSFAGEDADAMLAELLQCYLQDAPGMIQQIGQALDQQNYADLATAAHTLKSSSASLGAIQVSQLCSQLETLGRHYSSHPQLEQSQPTVTDLTSALLHAYEQVQVALNQELDVILQRLNA